MTSSQTNATASTSCPRILLINGPNLNLLGTREPQTYGSTTLADIETECNRRANASQHDLTAFQSNHEGAIVDAIHAARTDGTIGIVINAGAYTHTSVAIRDALCGVAIPFIEVHISNVHAREEFRHKSYLSDKAAGVILGLGVRGYYMAIDYFLSK